MKNESYKLLITTTIYAAGQIITQIFNLILLPIYTNKLGNVEYGKVSIISSFTGFISAFLVFQFILVSLDFTGSMMIKIKLLILHLISPILLELLFLFHFYLGNL